jgi:hypothetical protein
MPVQAAECHLRSRVGIEGVDDLALVRAEAEADRVTAVFSATDGTRHEVTVRREMAEPMRLTCHAEGAQPPPRWTPVTIT